MIDAHQSSDYQSENSDYQSLSLGQKMKNFSINFNGKNFHFSLSILGIKFHD